MWQKELIKYDVNEDVFNKILSDYSDYVIKVSNFNDYKFGYKGTDLENKKNYIAYDGDSWLVIKQFMLNGILNDHRYDSYNYCDKVPLDNTWKQVIVRLTREQNEVVEVGVNGLYAYNYMNKILRNVYDDLDIDERLSKFEAKYDPSKIQEHYVITERNKLLEFENCYKYDINSAHASALIEIFPKAAKQIRELYAKRKTNPKNKAILNYYVGYLCVVGHRETYNWIVQRTTKLLRDAAKETNGDIIYANTDGFIVQNPKKKLKASKTIGEFKEEYHGTVRFYKDKNWFVYELENPEKPEDKHKGTLALSIRDKVDLKKGKIVHYDKVKADNCFKIENIKMEKIKHEKEE